MKNLKKSSLNDSHQRAFDSIIVTFMDPEKLPKLLFRFTSNPTPTECKIHDSILNLFGFSKKKFKYSEPRNFDFILSKIRKFYFLFTDKMNKSSSFIFSFRSGNFQLF